jgi:ubiquinone/menaquinone biosynthesis C-methylase UbiE
METRIAMQITDAMVKRGHPRLDFRTEEGRRYAMGLAPYLSKIVNKDSKALDLGCGTGKSTFVLTELGASVIGIDISILSLKFAKEIAKTINAEAFHAFGDYAYLPFRSSSFDLALFPHNVVECSPEEFKRIIDETCRVLTINGYFVVTVSQKWCNNDSDSKPNLKNGSIEIPGQGTFSYPSFSWSANEVCRMANNAFEITDSIEMQDSKSKMLVFKKKNSSNFYKVTAEERKRAEEIRE